MNYSDDMKKMQQDAIRRVREMQARAKKNIENTRSINSNENNQENIQNRNQKGNHNSHQYSNQSKNRNKPPINQEKPKEELNIQPIISSNKNKNPTPKGSGINHIIDALLKDEEKTLILILILLLMSEKDNTELLLALIYLIL